MNNKAQIWKQVNMDEAVKLVWQEVEDLQVQWLVIFWGLFWGIDAMPTKFKEKLELKDVILAMANDLYKAKGRDVWWKRKFCLLYL